MSVTQKFDNEIFQQGCLIQLKIYGPGFTGKLSDQILADSHLPVEITRAMQDRLDRSLLKERLTLKSKIKTFIDNNSSVMYIIMFNTGCYLF